MEEEQELTPKEAGNAIRARRLKKGLSRKRLAKLSGVSRKFIRDLEAGNPRADLSKSLLVLEVVGLELPGVRESAGRYMPSLDVDLKAHLDTFKPVGKTRRADGA